MEIFSNVHAMPLGVGLIDFNKYKKKYPGPRSPVVLPPWGGEVGCSTRVEGEACPGPVKKYRQRLAPGLGGGPQSQHLVKQKKNIRKFLARKTAALITSTTTVK